MTQKTDLVDERFSQVNCAQTVFSLFADDLGLTQETALKIASGFGGGMTCAETCGAVTGAYMVIGMKYGHTSSDPGAKAATKNKIQLFNKKYKAKYGSLICKELCRYDISIPEGAAAAREEGVFENKCPLFIKTACSILENNF
jgi:C_GCAxxG_C_C family probable redox protein